MGPVSFWKKAFIVIVAGLPASFVLWPGSIIAQPAQGQVQTGQERPNPADFTDADLLDRAENLANSDSDLSDVTAQLEEALDSYYRSNLSGKRTAYERRVDPMLEDRLSPDELRALYRERFLSPGPIEFLGNHPLLFRLHRILGISYSRSNRTRHALQQFTEALRYTSLERPYAEPAEIAGPGAQGEEERQERQERQVQQTQTSEQMLSRMLLSFANETRITQEREAELQQEAQTVRETAERYYNTWQQWKQARRQVDVEQARLARTGQGDVQAARSNLEGLEQEMATLRERIRDLYTGPYRQYVQRENIRNADTFYRMAGLVRSLELQNKERQRYENRKSFLRGNGGVPGINFTVYRNFPGYRLWLELALELRPENMTYLEELARELKNSRHYERAILLEERYLEMATEEGNIPDENLAVHTYDVAGMYMAKGNYLRAADYYEQTLDYLDPRSESYTSRMLMLADVHYRHTGRYQRAEELYTQYLERTAEAPPVQNQTGQTQPEWKTLTLQEEERYRIYRNLAQIARNDIRFRREQDMLQNARRSFGQLEDRYNATLEEKRQLDDRINELKQTLVREENEQDQREYFRLLRVELPEMEQRTGFMQARLQSMNLSVVLERLAWLAGRRREFDRALALYREVVQRGDGNQIQRARQNIQRINGFLRSGYLQEPVVDKSY